MKKLINQKCIYFIGKPLEIKQQLSLLSRENTLLIDLIKLLAKQYKNSLN